MNNSISIITVCKNSIDDLKKTVDSILDLEYKYLEYIIIDGDSSDGTLGYITDLIQTFSNKHIDYKFISEADGGIYYAMNKGIMLAKNEWINFMNAGDLFHHSTCLNELFSGTISNQVSVLYGNAIEKYSFGEILISENKLNKKNTVMPFCHQASFVRNNVLKIFKFNTMYRIIADHDLFYRLRRENYIFEYRPVLITKYNAQYGISAENPILVNIEKLKIYGIDTKWYYIIKLIYVFVRSGSVHVLKNILSPKIVDIIMKRRRS